MKVLKKLWGYIKRKSHVKVVIKITLEADEKENVKAKVDVKVKGELQSEQDNAIVADTKLTKSDSGDGVDTLLTTNLKLKRFKATESEI